MVLFLPFNPQIWTKTNKMMDFHCLTHLFSMIQLQVVHLGMQKLMAEKNPLMSADDQDGTHGVNLYLGWIYNSMVSQYQLCLVWVLHFHETENIRPDMVVQQEIWLAGCRGSNEESLWHFWSRPVAALVVQETFFSLPQLLFGTLRTTGKIIKSSKGSNDALMLQMFCWNVTAQQFEV